MPWFRLSTILPNKSVKLLTLLIFCQSVTALADVKSAVGQQQQQETGPSKVDTTVLKQSAGEEEEGKALGEAPQSFRPLGTDQLGSPSFSDRFTVYHQMHHLARLPYYTQTGKMESPLPELPYLPYCSDPAIPCRDLSAHCLICDTGDYLGYNCTYGETTEYFCSTKIGVRCAGDPEFDFVAKCRMCYQTDLEEHSCVSPTSCKVGADPHRRVRKNCTVHHDVICLGRRRFYKTDTCDFSSGYRWSHAMLLSVTVGGFGGDRFYLGHWQEGVGKLFSFGGLGVWTIVDIILIAIGYLRPRDGSLYVDYQD